MHSVEEHNHHADGRLRQGDSLKFRCHPGLRCFATCCRDVNIFLSPYDILRMKKRLKISSTEFLERYTISLIPEVSGFPVILLKMQEEKNRACPFISPGGCSIYEDRPWACRMFPLDQGDQPGEYRFITDHSFCLGMKEGAELTVQAYLEGQGMGPYNESERLLGRIATDPRFSKTAIRNPKLQEMCRMALYDLDRFRRFVIESRFLEVFEVDKERSQKIAGDDMELLKLALQWLEFGLVAGDTFRIREDVLQGAKREE